MMMSSRLVKILMILAITSMVAACKLAVIVVEGGRVESGHSGTCLEGTICVHQVNDTNYTETFTAAPNSGWYFEKWNAGGGFFCQNSTDPICVVSGEGAEGNAAIEALIASDRTFYIMPVFVSSRPVTDTVTVDGKEWLQPKDFVSYSYNQVSEVCPEGVCTGKLPGSNVNLTGYIWASIDDAESLFSYYRQSPRRILEDFAYTGNDVDPDTQTIVNIYLVAMLSELREPTTIVAYVYGKPPPTSFEEEASITLNPFTQPSESDGEQGAWFWRAL
jgi:hypothetical protein